jgi:serine/threonine protein kinase
VAIKVIKIEKFKMSPKLEECTINEIQTLSKIEANEHVVKFVEILKTVNNYYFVYEYCNGGTLERMIKNEGHFAEQKALLYFMDMLKAFRTLSRYNIMHRDIKPGNILLHNGVIKIADFGFCKPLNSARDLAQTMLGSPIYMAPEILKG